MSGLSSVLTNPDGLQVRGAGVLCHITSLPNADTLGDFSAALAFIDFLHDSGIRVWQVLPLGPTRKDFSPYLCTSSQAGNPLLIDLQSLKRDGWLAQSDLHDYRFQGQSFQEHSSQGHAPQIHALLSEHRFALLGVAYRNFVANANTGELANYHCFIKQQQSWLKDFALFTAISRLYQDLSWLQWPESLRDRVPQALLDFQNEYRENVSQILFEQFVFFKQWHHIKAYAHKKGVTLFGDMPFYVAHDSVELWSKRHLFKVDETGEAQQVAGVPPDYFSDSGQKWGNPVYHWDTMADDHFQWWLDRLSSQLELYDLLRIDHFRALQAYWEIPAESDDAREGRWQATPGRALLALLQAKLGVLPLVVEDLGYITPEVHALRDEFDLSGMKVVQFAFDGSADNPYLLDNHIPNCVVYTGTHDNNTVMGWYNSLDDNTAQLVLNEIARHIISEEDERKDGDKDVHNIEVSMPWPLIDYTFSSKAQLAMITMQDLLGLGNEARFNTPGTVEGNWLWQFDWQDLSADLSSRIRQLVSKHGRL